MSLVPSALALLRTAISDGLTSPPRRRAVFVTALAVLVVGMSLKYAAKTAKPARPDAGTGAEAAKPAATPEVAKPAAEPAAGPEASTSPQADTARSGNHANRR